jgi:cystathionine beta-lyase/cystathionine gamma-synthase
LHSQAVAEELAALEGGEAALLFSSGMAAISCALLALLRSGDHLICHKEIFSQTRSLLDAVLSKFNIAVTYIDMNDRVALRNAIVSNTKILYAETPSNPSLDVVDLGSVAGIAKDNGLLLLVDSTLATPAVQKPLAMGASLVFHSATKYLAGHADVLSGVMIGNKNLIADIRTVQKLTGGVMDPHAAYLLGRGMKTLALRMQQVCNTALQIAGFLSSHPKVRWIRYPFLDSHPHTAVARSQMQAGGGIISFELHGGLPTAKKFVASLRLIHLATSLGGTDSTIEIPYELKKIRNDYEETMGLIRLSIGIEDPTLLKNDIENALQL